MSTSDSQPEARQPQRSNHEGSDNAKEIMDLPTASLTSSQSKVNDQSVSRSLPRQENPNPALSDSTVSVRSQRTQDSSSNDKPEKQPTAIQQKSSISDAQGPKLFNLSKKTSKASKASRAAESKGDSSGNSRSESPISIIVKQQTNPPVFKKEEQNSLLEDEKVDSIISNNVKTVEHVRQKEISLSPSDSIEMSEESFSFQEISQKIAAPPVHKFSEQIQFTQIAAGQKPVSDKIAPPVPPRIHRVEEKAKFREIQPGELPICQALQPGFERNIDDKNCWVSAQLTGLLNKITETIIQLTGRCE